MGGKAELMICSRGVILIKRGLLLVLAIIMLVSATACGKNKNSQETSGSNIPEEATAGPGGEEAAGTAAQDSGALGSQEQSPAEPEQDANEGSTNSGNLKTELLQSASVDLDADGTNEQVEAILTTLPASEQDMPDVLEGTLVIRSKGKEKKILFSRREEGLTSLLTSMQFEDLDNDGSKDVFMIIPDHGASFSYSTYLAYSYKKDKSYTFTSDNALADYIAGFQTSYTKGGNKLTFVNKTYGFEADLAIEEGDQQPLQDTMADYADRTWIEPVAVDIGENSRLALEKSPDGRMEIKVPLPIFGMATVNMIGEMDLFYTLDSNLEPVLRHFDMWDFNGGDPDDRVKAGSCAVE